MRLLETADRVPQWAAKIISDFYGGINDNERLTDVMVADFLEAPAIIDSTWLFTIVNKHLHLPSMVINILIKVSSSMPAACAYILCMTV